MDTLETYQAAALACRAALHLRTTSVVDTGLPLTTFGNEGVTATTATVSGSGSVGQGP
jgi:hypothetical protein